MVQAECKTIASVLDVFILDGRITVLNDEMLPASLFLSLLERYQLGEGETECLAFACQGDDIVCCDDRRARAMITRELGEGRVTGTLGILIRMIHHGLIESQSAIAAYEQMRRQGGFLPEVSVQDLDKAAEFMRD